MYTPLDFDTTADFYPGIVTDDEQKYFNRLTQVRDVTREALYYLRKAGLEVYISYAKRFNETDAVIISARSGLNVLTVRGMQTSSERRPDGFYEVTIETPHADLKSRGNSQNARSSKTAYLTKILKNCSPAIAKTVLERQPSMLLHSTFEPVTSTCEALMNNPHASTKSNVRNVDLIAMLGIMDGSTTFEDLSANVQAGVTNIRSHIKGINHRMQEVQNKIDGFFCMPKWVLAEDNGHFMDGRRLHIGVIKASLHRTATYVPRDGVQSIKMGDYMAEYEWLAKPTMYRDLEHFVEHISEDEAKDIGLSISTARIRYKDAHGIDFDSYVPSGHHVDIDSGVSLNRIHGYGHGVLSSFIFDYTGAV